MPETISHEQSLTAREPRTIAAMIDSAKIEAFVHGLPHPAWLATSSGDCACANAAFRGLTGLTSDQLQQADWLTFLLEEDREFVKVSWQRSLARSTPYHARVRIRGFDDVPATVELIGFAHNMSDGQELWLFIGLCAHGASQYDSPLEAQLQAIIDDRRRVEDRSQQQNVPLRGRVDPAPVFEEIVGASPALTSVLSRVSKVADSESTVLITGETGTGKELVARAIHRRSRRASRAFVPVNCAAIPRDLIASELFGHEKGAFTGAFQPRLGRFELANGGTIFLDEVGELSSDIQVALLRVLQEREFERVGGRQPIQVDLRVIAATNRDLTAAVADGTFREDLFYRLNVFPLEVPALRERVDDIPALVEYFIDRYARKAGKTFRRIGKRALDRLKSYPWPGNVRELQNVIERSVILCDTDEFTIDGSWLFSGPTLDGRLGLSRKVVSHEKTLVEDALRATGGRVFGPSGAAARLGVPRSTLESRIRALRIDKAHFRARAAKSARDVRASTACRVPSRSRKRSCDGRFR